MFVAWNMTWTHCEVYWELDFELSETSGGQPVALGGFGVWPPVLVFFLLHAAKVRSSYEEGPGRNALQSAYHNPKLDVTD